MLSKLKDTQEGNRKPVDPATIHPVFGVPGGKIRVEDDQGNVTLYAKTIKHLMNHLIHALEYEERDLFVDQILSQITIDEFEERGKKVEWLFYKNEGHGFFDPEHNKVLYSKLKSFFEKNIGKGESILKD